MPASEHRGFTLILRHAQDQRSFTLIELLITIGVVTILSVVVVLTLNPAQLLRQARDSTRLSDLDTLNRAINLHQVDVPSGSLGSANTVYVSLPDSSATCGNSGLPPLPSGWAYRCATSANYRKVDGNGWLPVNFTQLSLGSPLGTLPVDPVNATSTGNYYYTYATGASWELAALMESDKYKANQAADGGVDPAMYETGSSLNLSPFIHGLRLYLDANDPASYAGSGSTWYDLSGFANNAAMTNLSSANWVTVDGIKAFETNDTNDQEFKVSNWNEVTPRTWEIWVKPKTTGIGWQTWIDNGATERILFGHPDANLYVYPSPVVTGAVVANQWAQYAFTMDESKDVKIYKDGNLLSSPGAYGYALTLGSQTLYLLGDGGAEISSAYTKVIRIYNRPLSAAEIKALYDATK